MMIYWEINMISSGGKNLCLPFSDVGATQVVAQGINTENVGIALVAAQYINKKKSLKQALLNKPSKYPPTLIQNIPFNPLNRNKLWD